MRRTYALVLVLMLGILFGPNCLIFQSGHPSNTAFYNASVAGSSGGSVAPQDTDARGVACATAYGIPLFYVTFAVGDATVQTAAANGNIKKISSVSHEVKMSSYKQDWCTIVRGQQ